MIQWFSKKLRNRKGFTLIELIVVIAILGILALIAVPRFAGFTERANIAADEQLAQVVANSLQMLIAAGEIGVSEPTNVKVSNSDASAKGLAYVATPALNVDGATLKAEMDKLVGSTEQLTARINFIVSITATGDVNKAGITWNED